MNYVVRPGKIEDLMRCQWLTQEHYEEIADKRRKLSVDWDEYKNLEALGLFYGLGAWYGDAMIGYSGNIVKRNIHYDMVMAYNCALFVHPDHRVSPVGLKLMRETKALCKDRGAELMLWHCKPNTSLHSLLDRKQLEIQDIVYQEQL